MKKTRSENAETKTIKQSINGSFIDKNMAQFSPETVWSINEKELLNLLNANALVPKSKKAHFYAPSFINYKTSHYCSSPTHFPTISVTGKNCALNCKHCRGRVLETMHPVSTPQKLLELATKLKQNGALGFLLSGGCLPDGSVPLKPFIPTIHKITRELDLAVFVHTGIIDLPTASALRNAGVNAALIDVVGSDETIKHVCNLNVAVKDYANSLKALQEAGINFVPHVIVGLHDGKLKGEFHALKIIASTKPSAIVIIAFMPIRGTPMAAVKPSQPTDIARVIAAARVMFPETPLVLGCMRPKGKHRDETDILALKAGANAIAFPTEEAIKYAETQGYEISFSPHCCAQIYLDTPVEPVRSPSK